MTRTARIATLAFVAMLAAGAVETASAAPRTLRPYIGWNPVALGTLVNGLFTKVAIGMLGGNGEYAVSIYGGIRIAAGQYLELRVSTGPANQIRWGSQLHVGYLVYPCEVLLGWDGGPAVGLFARSHALLSEPTGIWFFTHVPEVVAGWRIPVNSVAVDLRLGYNPCAWTWSTEPRSGLGFAPIMFPLGFTLWPGIVWQPDPL